MYQVTRSTNPDRFEVEDEDGWAATFTFGAYTVRTRGPARSLAHPGSPAVEHTTWVRTYPGPFDGKRSLDRRWLDLALAANQDGVADVLALALAYCEGAADVWLGEPPHRLRIAGKAAYGPGNEEGSDFNDYLGLRWTYPNGESDEPEDDPDGSQHGCLDCSGFVRMVLGYRHHLPGSGYPGRVPLSLQPTADRSTLPRRAHQILRDGPGVVIVHPDGRQVIDLSPIGVGDLVFFDGDTGDGAAIDHVGIFMGIDGAGHHRFISSRKTPRGPNMSDVGYPSILDGNAHYARRFRAVRRV
jgi:cell wall-associated NlpC family hydrolase